MAALAVLIAGIAAAATAGPATLVRPLMRLCGGHGPDLSDASTTDSTGSDLDAQPTRAAAQTQQLPPPRSPLLLHSHADGSAPPRRPPPLAKMRADSDEEQQGGEKMRQATRPRRAPAAVLLALLWPLLTGLSNGTMMMPFTSFTRDSDIKARGGNAALMYLPCFALGAVAASALFLLLRTLSRGCRPPAAHLRAVAPYALTTGMFWACGNFCATYATQVRACAQWPSAC